MKRKKIIIACQYILLLGNESLTYKYLVVSTYEIDADFYQTVSQFCFSW